MVTLNSVPVVESTCCPLIYKEPDDRYKSLHCFVGDPKSIVSVVSGIIDTLDIRPAVDIEAVAVVFDILAKFRPVTESAGTLVRFEPSPLKDPVKEPDNSANSVLSEVSSILILPLLPLLIFILLLPVPISNSEAIILFKLPSLSLISTSPEPSLLILVPPISTVLPAKYMSFHRSVSLPKS